MLHAAAKQHIQQKERTYGALELCTLLRSTLGMSYNIDKYNQQAEDLSETHRFSCQFRVQLGTKIFGAIAP